MNTKRTLTVLANAIVIALSLYSCKDNPYKGYTLTENGAYMKFHKHGTDTIMPKDGDMVSFTLVQTLLGEPQLVADELKPIEVLIGQRAFAGDIFDALSVMTIGDSATLMFSADSLFLIALEQDNVPDEYKNTMIYYDMKLLDVKKAEQLNAEYRLWIDELKIAEQQYLQKIVTEEKATISEQGLVILSHKTLKTRPMTLGEYALVDVVLCNNANDTLINSNDIIVQGGLNEICKGVDQALLLMHKGETIKCVIPSSLAFDSIGMEEMILPYEPLHLDMKLTDVFNDEEYNAYVTRQEEIEKAEYEKRAKEQNAAIAKYLEKNEINAEPTESGLYVKLINQGSGNAPKVGQTVTINYVIYNLKGEKVESSYDNGQPMEFMLGVGQMIRGVEETLLNMNEGSKVHVVMPSTLAFDDIEIDPNLLPAHSPVAMDIELIAVN